MADFNRESKTFEQLVTFTRASTGTYYDAQGVLQTAAVDEPRLTHDPETKEALGLLIEEQRTNLLLWSEAFDDGVWEKNATGTGVLPVVTANAANSPRKDLTADRLVFDRGAGDTGGDSSLIANKTFSGGVAGNTYVASVYIKSATAQDQNVFVYFNRGATIVSEVVTVGQEYVRVILPLSINTNGRIDLQIGTLGGTGALGGADRIVDVYAWGAQLEAGSFPTSYIKNEASQVTRAADNASVDTLTPWFNASEGTIYFEGSAEGVSGLSQPIISADDGAFERRTQIYLDTNNKIAALTESNGVSSGGLVSAVTSGSGAFKAAISRTTSGITFSVNGQPSLTFSGNIGADPATRLRFCKFAPLSSTSGAIVSNSVRFIPRALSATELEALTAP